MLFGEHAVLHGHHSLSCAIDKRLFVRLTPTADNTITISSNLGTSSCPLSSINLDAKFGFVSRAIQSKQALLPSGFSLDIDSQFSHLFGLGSSAAVTIATLGALSLWLDGKIDRQLLFDESLSVVRSIQGTASGADIAASIFGGIVLYQMSPCSIEPLPHLFPLTVVYSGSKMTTREVIQHVQTNRAKWPSLFDNIFDIMNQTTLLAADAIRQEDWKKLGELLNVQQGLMDAIGVGNLALSEIVYSLRKERAILGSKISGSGLGDCAIGLGHAQLDSYPVLETQMSQTGVRHE